MCEHCGVYYSFVFRVQYHKSDCPLVTEDPGQYVKRAMAEGRTQIGETIRGEKKS